MIIGKKSRPNAALKVNSKIMRESIKVLLSGLTIDNDLTFEEYLSNLCRIANYKLHPLRRTRKYLTHLFSMHPFSSLIQGVEKGCTGNEWAKILCFAFINSHFNYVTMIDVLWKIIFYKNGTDTSQSS